MKIEVESTAMFLGLAVLVFLIPNTYFRFGAVTIGLVWVIMDVYINTLSAKLHKKERVIYCDWENRINETDFTVQEKSAIFDLNELGYDFTSALGEKFIFHSEKETGIDIFFTGTFVKTEEGQYIIRAFDANELATNT